MTKRLLGVLALTLLLAIVVPRADETVQDTAMSKNSDLALTEQVVLLEINNISQVDTQVLNEIGLRSVSESQPLYEASWTQVSSLEERGIRFEIHRSGLRFQARSVFKGSVYGYNETDTTIFDNDGWAYSPISITMAPADLGLLRLLIHSKVAKHGLSIEESLISRLQRVSCLLRGCSMQL